MEIISLSKMPLEINNVATSRRQSLHKKPSNANNVAISRRQKMHRSNSHLSSPHPCTSFTQMPSEITNMAFSSRQPLPQSFNAPGIDISQPPTGSGLNDDHENAQSKLNNALLSTFILAPFQCNQLDTKHTYGMTSI